MKTPQLTELQAEIERLKGIIEEASRYPFMPLNLYKILQKGLDAKSQTRPPTAG